MKCGDHAEKGLGSSAQREEPQRGAAPSPAVPITTARRALIANPWPGMREAQQSSQLLRQGFLKIRPKFLLWVE